MTVVTTSMGHALRAYRSKNDLTLRTAAEGLEENVSTLHRIEQGRSCSNQTFVKLVRLFKIKYKDLEAFASPELKPEGKAHG